MFSHGILDELFANPWAVLSVFLVALPGRLLAISAHEAAHGWVAERCGDPTARMMGRVTLNPLKHLDPIGILCMVVFGIGWAKPVPVNPRNFRNFRKDDLKVSVAGICMNLILFGAGIVVMYAFLALTLAQVPTAASLYAAGDMARTVVDGSPVLVMGQYYYALSDVLKNGISLSELVIEPVFGSAAGVIYQMLGHFVMTNLVLAVFNLLPVPPLDGYHVLNDLLLKRQLFVSPKVQRVSMLVLYLALFSGVLTRVLSAVYGAVLNGIGTVMILVFRAFGLY